MKRTKRASFGRKLRVECLEGRRLLAGGFRPVPAPVITVNNDKVAVQDISPGATDKLLAQLTLKTSGKQYGRLDEAIFLAASGGERLSGNVNEVTLKADLNGKAKDGCEAVIGTGTVDYQTDLVDITMTRPVWTRSTALKVQVYANMSGWQFSGDTLGVELAWAGFSDLRGNWVPDGNVIYAGVDPILHTLETATVGLSQAQMLPANSVFAGDKNVDLLDAYAWTQGAAADTVSFTTIQGNLSDMNNYFLKADINGDGIYEASVRGDVFTQVSTQPKTKAVTTSTLVFKLDSSFPFNGSKLSVFADIVSAPVGKMIQLAFANGSPVTAHSTDTGVALKGVRINGMGEGQIAIYNQPGATVYNIVTRPEELVIKEFGSTISSQFGGQYGLGQAHPGDTVVIDAGSFYAPVNGVTVSHVGLKVVGGDVTALRKYSFWADINNDGNLVQLGQSCTASLFDIYFDDLGLALAAGQSVRYEVRGIVPDPLGCNYIQAQFAGAASVVASRSDGTALAADKIYAESQWQAAWQMQQNPPSGVTVADLLAQIAALQAQLQAMQPGGLG